MSLSIEEQFYFFFPFLIIFFKKNLSVILKSLIVLPFFSISLTQFGGNLRFDYPYIEKNLNFYSIPQFAFYFTFTRIWEIILGVLIAIYLKNNKYTFSNTLSELLSFLGLMAIVYSVLFFSKDTRFPSLYALVPTIGTGLVIIFGNKSILVKKTN